MDSVDPLSHLAPDLSSLLRSNRLPNDIQRQELFHLVAVETEREEGLLKELRASRVRRHAYKTILSSLREFPMELLSVIFEHVMLRDENAHDHEAQNRALFVLSRVCTHWRNVCFGCLPHLWAHLGGKYIASQAVCSSEPPEITIAWFERAKNCPVQVDIAVPRELASWDSSLKDISLPTLLQYGARIGTLSLQLKPPSEFVALQPSDLTVTLFPCLQTLAIQVLASDHAGQAYDPEAGITALAPVFPVVENLQAPQLRHFMFTGGHVLPMMQTFWGQLSTLQLKLVSASDDFAPTGNVFQTLQHFLSLRSLSLTLVDIYADKPQRRLVFRQLEVISLNLVDFPRRLGDILDHVVCPNLRSLDLFFGYDSPDSELLSLEDFHARSGFSLQKLALRGLMDISSDEVWFVVEEMGTVEELIISRLADGFDILHELCYIPHPLPWLRSLCLTPWIIPSEPTPNMDKLIIELVQKRCQMVGGRIGRLKEIQIARDIRGKSEWDDGSIVSAETIRLLQPYVDLGLKLDFDPYPYFSEEKDYSSS